MKYSILILLITVILFSGFQSFSQELAWFNWEEGYEKAKDEKKIMLIDAYTDWCSWCKVMDKKTYKDTLVIKMIEENFIPIKLNPDLAGTYTYNKVDYTGPELIKYLADGKFQGYPTTFFIFPKKDNRYMEVGYLDAKYFLTVLQKYQDMK